MRFPPAFFFNPLQSSYSPPAALSTGKLRGAPYPPADKATPFPPGPNEMEVGPRTTRGWKTRGSPAARHPYGTSGAACLNVSEGEPAERRGGRDEAVTPSA